MKKERVKINEYLFFQEGPGVRNTQYTLKGVKLLNVANLVDGKVDLSTSDRYISEKEAYGKYKHFLVDEGDLIVASSGIKVEYMDKKMGFVMKDHLPLCMNTSTIRFKSLNNKNLDIRYFMYFLKSLDFKKQLNKEITGSAQLNYGPSHLKKMTFIIVDKENQLRVIKKLESIEKIIDFYQTQLKNLDLLIKSRFVEMFGDIKNNDRSFEVKRLEEVCNGIGDGLHGTPEYINNDTKYPFINGNNLHDGRIIINSSTKYVSKETYEKNLIEMNGNTILISINGTLGKIAFYNNETLMLGKSACYCNLKKDINKVFVYYLMKSDRFLEYMEENATASTIKNVGLKAMRDYRIILPSIELQNNFASFVAQVDKSKFAVQEALNKTKMLMDSLMQEYFG